MCANFLHEIAVPISQSTQHSHRALALTGQIYINVYCFSVKFFSMILFKINVRAKTNLMLHNKGFIASFLGFLLPSFCYSMLKQKGRAW